MNYSNPNSVLLKAFRAARGDLAADGVSALSEARLAKSLDQSESAKSVDGIFLSRRISKQARALPNELRLPALRPGPASDEQILEMQKVYRTMFGKRGLAPPSIGDHPDYEHLKVSGEVSLGYSVTMFMDVVGSTQLGVLLTPEEVYTVKNAFIQVAIALVLAFDGHVHRLMGDAVLAFFNRSHKPTEQAIVDALNCAALLRQLTEVVSGELASQLGTVDLGIRIGLDYGEREAVLWAPYGFPGAGELTATSFYVDAAAKLQQSAGHNGVMIGESLRAHIDFPLALLEVKTTEGQEEPFLLPNYQKADGTPLNYRKYQLRWREYLSCGPMGRFRAFGFDGLLPLPVTVSLHGEENGPPLDHYHGTSVVVEKDMWLKFDPQLTTQIDPPYVVTFQVQNHGAEATAAGDLGQTPESYQVFSVSKAKEVHRWRRVSYRGLHYMTIRLIKDGVERMARRVGVFGY